MTTDGDNALLKAAHTGIGSRAKVVHAAKKLLAYQKQTGRVHYTMDSRRMTIVRHKLRPPFNSVIFEDCSSSVTAYYWIAGAADPNGLDYNGLGYTGTLCQHGEEVDLADARPGDLLFYGSGAPWSHVTIVVGGPRGREAISHGSEGGPRLLPFNYRTVGQARRYLP